VREAAEPGSAHGPRKRRATIEAENGVSGAKLDALFGWRIGSKTSAINIRKADRLCWRSGPSSNVVGPGVVPLLSGFNSLDRQTALSTTADAKGIFGGCKTGGLAGNILI